MATVGQVDLTALVAELAERASPRSEADVQAGIRALLLYGDLNLDDPKVRPGFRGIGRGTELS
jgi:hypothetical protein